MPMWEWGGDGEGEGTQKAVVQQGTGQWRSRALAQQGNGVAGRWRNRARWRGVRVGLMRPHLDEEM